VFLPSANNRYPGFTVQGIEPGLRSNFHAICCDHDSQSKLILPIFLSALGMLNDDMTEVTIVSVRTEGGERFRIAKGKGRNQHRAELGHWPLDNL
jgi:hypothetical protein